MLKSWQHISARKTEVLCAEAVLAHLAGACKGGGEGCHLMASLARLLLSQLTFPGAAFQASLHLRRLFPKCLQLQKQPMSFAMGFGLEL